MHGNQANDFNNSHRIKYLKHLGLLIGFFGLLFVIEALLIKLGTTTNYSNAFSSLLIGGTLISSLFILFNAVLLLSQRYFFHDICCQLFLLNIQ